MDTPVLNAYKDYGIHAIKEKISKSYAVEIKEKQGDLAFMRSRL